MAATRRLTAAEIAARARARGLDPDAVLRVAGTEGLSGGIGDGGHAFGPFQLNNAGGAYPAAAPQDSNAANEWAWSPQGVDYALGGIQKVAGGLKGPEAVRAIVTRFERPANPAAEITKALGGQTVQAPAGAAPSPPGQAAGAVALARQQIGTPYSWGGGNLSGPTTGIGRGAATKGFDCSSLLQFVYGKQGVKIPRVTYDQFKTGTPVAQNQLRPGDAVFFHPGPQGPEHVGMYLGGGKFIEAPHTGASVRISELAGRSDFMGGRRYANGPATAEAAQAAVAKLGAPAKPQNAPGGRQLPAAVQQALQVLRA